MAIRHSLSGRAEDFMRALAQIARYKSDQQWQQALDLIDDQADPVLWSGEVDDVLLRDKSKKEAIEFQLKLKFQEIGILKSTGAEHRDKTQKLAALTDRFLAAHADTFFMELNDLRAQLEK